MPITQLPPPTQARLRSTQILSSLTQIVSELLQNSLDADAHQVDVGVDCEDWACWVTDDGVGISKDALDVLGEGLDGGRYCTSKSFAAHTINALETFGFRGEALASIADLSCLEICSRTARARDTWSVIVKGGKSLYNGSAVRWRRESPGTTVHVRDAFYNLPVRRRSHLPPTRVLERIRFELENQRGTGTSRDNILRIPKTNSTLATFRHLYGKALAKDVESIDVTSDSMKLDGFISLVGIPSKTYQFLYVNKHFLSQCDLHRVIDSVFATSTFHRNVPDEESYEGPRVTVSRRSPRKADKRPIYIINLTLPPDRIDNCVEPDKSAIHIQDMNSVASFLGSAIRTFLSSHGYLDEFPNTETTDKANSGPSRKRRRMQSEEYDGELSNRVASIDRLRRASGTAPPSFDLHHESEPQNWMDSRTGQNFIIDSRTGNTVPQARNFRVNDCHTERRTLPSQTSVFGAQSVRTAAPDWLNDALKNNSVYVTGDNGTPVGSACYGSYDTCLKMAEPRTESRAPLNRFEKSDLKLAEVIGQVDRKFVACLIRGKEIPTTRASPGPQEQEYNVTSDSRVVLIDQHAADERVRVERYLKELCLGFLDNRKCNAGSQNCVKVQNLEPPTPLLLTRREGLKLSSSHDLQQYFSWWGICFSDFSNTGVDGPEFGSDAENSTEYVQVHVKCIPQVIGDKLTTKDELRNLVKSVISHPITGGLNDQEPDQSEDCSSNGSAWVSGLRYCPQELLDLINSKACRGAIMFNDSLDLEQCKKLVNQLSDTVFPFQCAHGRPSLVPVANIANSGPRRREVTRYGWSRLEEQEANNDAQGLGLPMLAGPSRRSRALWQT